MKEKEIIQQQDKIKHQDFKKKVLFLSICSCLATTAVGISIGCAITKNAIPSELREFISVYQTLSSEFYLDTNTRTLVDGLYYGLTNSFNEPYTYYTSTANGEVQNYSIEACGLGISRDPYYGNCLIKRVMQTKVQKDPKSKEFIDPPAKAAGLLDGDIIYAVQNINGDGSLKEKIILKDCPYDTWSSYFSGEKGSQIKVFYLRNNVEKETTVIRGDFVSDPVYINYINVTDEEVTVSITISTFLGSSLGDILYNYLIPVVTQYKKIDHLIIDLRGNGGGYVDNCVDALGVFLPYHSVALYYEKQNGKKEYKKTQRKEQIQVTNNHIDLLIDDDTASAGESFVTGLKDNDVMNGVKVYGQISYGKGIAQDFINVENRTGMIRYTFAKTYSVKDNCINHVGIVPDVECGYTPSNQNIYRVYIQGVADNSSLSVEQKETVIGKINAILGTKYDDFDTALNTYQNYYTSLTTSGVFDEKTASHIQEKMYLIFSNNASVDYNITHGLYKGYVQGKDDNDLFSSQQRLMVKYKINNLLNENYSSFDTAVKGFQETFNLTDKNGIFDKETADLLQGKMYDLGQIENNKVVEACQ